MSQDRFCPRHGRASRPVEVPGLRCDCLDVDSLGSGDAQALVAEVRALRAERSALERRCGDALALIARRDAEWAGKLRDVAAVVDAATKRLRPVADPDPADRQRAIAFIRAEAEAAMAERRPEVAGAFDLVAQLLDEDAAAEVRKMRDERDAAMERAEEAERQSTWEPRDPSVVTALPAEGWAMSDHGRLLELLDRLVAPGAKAAHVSASETHEISDAVRALLAELADNKRRIEWLAHGRTKAEMSVMRFEEITLPSLRTQIEALTAVARASRRYMRALDGVPTSDDKLAQEAVDSENGVKAALAHPVVATLLAGLQEG